MWRTPCHKKSVLILPNGLSKFEERAHDRNLISNVVGFEPTTSRYQYDEFTYTNTHTQSYTYIHANTQQRRMHVKTYACTRACARVHPHTHKVLFRDRRPEFVESLAAHCQGGWIQFIKQILKTVVFSQSFEIPACF